MTMRPFSSRRGRYSLMIAMTETSYEIEFTITIVKE